jgi:hypothetical protein
VCSPDLEIKYLQLIKRFINPEGKFPIFIKINNFINPVFVNINYEYHSLYDYEILPFKEQYELLITKWFKLFKQHKLGGMEKIPVKREHARVIRNLLIANSKQLHLTYKSPVDNIFYDIIIPVQKKEDFERLIYNNNYEFRGTI